MSAPRHLTDPGAHAELFAGLLAGMFARGMILLWSGGAASVPDGWSLCDGTNGTPDLRNRFVVGAGDAYAVGATGGGTSHAHTGAVDAASAGGTVNATTLTASTIPAHTHTYTYGSGEREVSYGAQTTVVASTYSGNTGSVGSSGGHTHGFTGSSHSHGTSIASADNRPPYYALAYIMKL